MSAIEVRSLTKLYGRTKALDDVSLALKPGRIVGLLGRNGAGKTTLLNIIANKLFATSGTVLVDGVEACENAAAQAKIFYMTEKNLYPATMRVRDAFRWTMELYPNFDAGFANVLAQKFALDTKMKVKELSTGYSSIFKLILALSSGAGILIFDEPVLGLDANHRVLFYKELIARYSEKPSTIIISTHLIEEVSDVLEEAAIIKQGSIILHERVETLLQTAYTVSGATEAVDGFTTGKKVIAVEAMGRFKAATVQEAQTEDVAADARARGLDVTPATLQELFIDLTNS